MPRHSSRLQKISWLLFWAVLGVQAWAYTNIVTDDAFIFYRYADNIAAGHGYVFNPGERVFGTTSPLYTLILAGCRRLLIGLPISVLPLLGSLISAISMAAIALIAADLFRQARLLYGAWLVPLILLALPPFWSGVGMDVLPAIALGLAAIREYGNGRVTWAAVLSALAVLARPDLACVPVLLLADSLALRRRLPQKRSVFAFLAIVGPWLLFSQWYFGTLVPQTVAAKFHQASSGAWGGGFIFLKMSTKLWPFHASIKDAILVLFGLAGAVVALHWRPLRSFHLGWLTLVWVACHMLVYGFVLKPAAYPWYYAPFALGIGITLALGGEIIAGRIRSRHIRACFIVCCVAWAALTGFRMALTTLRAERHYKWRFHTEAAAWLNERAPDGAVVACNEIGVLGFYYRKGPILDLLGLVSPEVLAALRERDFSRPIQQFQPDYVISKEPPFPVLEDFVQEEWFQQSHDLEAVFGTEHTKMRLYRRRVP